MESFILLFTQCHYVLWEQRKRIKGPLQFKRLLTYLLHLPKFESISWWTCMYTKTRTVLRITSFQLGLINLQGFKAFKASWSFMHECGHTELKDKSVKPPSWTLRTNQSMLFKKESIDSLDPQTWRITTEDIEAQCRLLMEDSVVCNVN